MRPIEIYNGYSFSRFANVCGEAYINKEDFLALVRDSMSREDFEAWFAEHLSANALETVDGEVYIHLFALAPLWGAPAACVAEKDAHVLRRAVVLLGSKMYAGDCGEKRIEQCMDNVNNCLAELVNPDETTEENCQLYRKLTENLFEAYVAASRQYYGRRALLGTHPFQSFEDAAAADAREQAGQDGRLEPGCPA